MICRRWAEHVRRAAACVVVLAGLLHGAEAAAWPDDEAVLNILRARIDTMQMGVGMVVAMVDRSGTRIVAQGTTAPGGARVNGRTLFEVGSISKVFTATILADMADRGEVRLLDPLVGYLPAGATPPIRDGRQIRLIDLALHRSGLPRMPDDLPVGDDGSYGPYPAERMQAFLDRTTLPLEVGEKYHYSNLGYGVLGEALARRAGTDFDRLLGERICEPLGLPDTVTRMSDEQRSRAARGHDWTREPAPDWPPGGLDAAGGVRSTAADLAEFLKAHMGIFDTPLWRAAQKTQIDRETTTFPNLEMALGWHLLKDKGREIVWHSGATFGFVSFIGFERDAGRGVVVLSNARGLVDDIALHLIDPEFKLAKPNPPPRPTSDPVDPALLEAYAGAYEASPGQVIEVTQADGRLFVTLNEGLRVEALPVAKDEFVMKLAPVVFEFEGAGKGKAEALNARFMGTESRAPRISDPHRALHRVPSAPAGQAALAGVYEGDGQRVTVTAGDDGLWIQGEGQLRMPLTPVAGGGYWAQEAEAEVRLDGEGGDAALVVTQKGKTHRLGRIDDPPAGTRDP